MIRASCGPLGICDFEKVKAMTLLFGLRELKKLGASECLVECDSGTVIS